MGKLEREKGLGAVEEEYVLKGVGSMETTSELLKPS